MIDYNNDKTVKSLESYLSYYTESLDILRSFTIRVTEAESFFKTIDPGSKDKEFSHIKELMNFCGFLTVSLLDLIVICKNLTSSLLPWERIYNYRLGYLLIYESNKTYEKHIKQLKEFVATYPELMDLFRVISTDLKMFKNGSNFDGAIHDVRHWTVGHIDKDFEKYYNTIKAIDENKAIQAIVTYIQILTKMQELSKELTTLLTMKTINEAELISSSNS